MSHRRPGDGAALRVGLGEPAVPDEGAGAQHDGLHLGRGEQTVDGFKKFVKISLYPEMRFAEGSKVENLQKAIDGTKKRCLVTNSMALQVDVIPKILE